MAGEAKNAARRRPNSVSAPRGILFSAAMRITSVRAFLLSYPFDKPIRLPFFGGERTILKRDAMFIRVDTDSGLTG